MAAGAEAGAAGPPRPTSSWAHPGLFLNRRRTETGARRFLIKTLQVAATFCPRDRSSGERESERVRGYCARSSRTGIFTRCRTRSTVVPLTTSARKRWPCVDMAIRSTPSACDSANQLGRRIAHRQLAADREALASQRRLERRQVLAVGAHLFRFAQLEIVEVARRQAVGDVHQQQLGPGQPRQLADVQQDRAVGVGVLDGDQNAFVHGLNERERRTERRTANVERERERRTRRSIRRDRGPPSYPTNSATVW